MRQSRSSRRMQHAPDNQLLKQYLKTGDQSAFQALASRHASMVFSTARRLLNGDESAADDVTQAVFILLVKKAGKLTGRHDLTGWLYRATQYIAQSHRSKETRRAKAYRKQAQEVPAMAPSSGLPEQALIQQEISEHIDETLLKLTSKQREIILLHYFRHMPISKIGKELKLPEGTVQSRLAQALKTMRRTLSRRKVGVTPSIITTVLTACGAKLAPSHVIVHAVAAGTNASISPTALALAEGGAKFMLLAKIKTAAVVVACSIVSATVILGAGRMLPVSDSSKQKDVGAVKDEPAASTQDESAVKTDVPWANTGTVWADLPYVSIRKNSPSKSRTAVWRNNAVYLRAAKGEYESFQFRFQPKQTIQTLKVEMEWPDGTVIDPDRSAIFRIGYLPVKKPANQDGKTALEEWSEGLYSIQTASGIAKGENLGFVIRTFVSRNARPGAYSGVLHVSGTVAFDIKVNLDVLPFTMPAIRTLPRVSPVWWWGGFVNTIYGDIADRDPDTYHRLIEEYLAEFQRAALVPSQNFDGKSVPLLDPRDSGSVDAETLVKQYRRFFDKGMPILDVEFYYSAYRNILRYGFYSYLIPELEKKLASARDAKTRRAIETRLNKIKKYKKDIDRGKLEDTVQFIHAVSKAFEDNGLIDRVFIQTLADEPTQIDRRAYEKRSRTHCSYKYVAAVSTLIRQAAPKLKIWIAEHPAPQLFPYIDYFNAMYINVNPDDGRELSKMGKSLFAYSMDSDSPKSAIAYRSHGWFGQRYNLKGIYSWNLYQRGAPDGAFASLISGPTKDGFAYRQSLFFDGKALMGMTGEHCCSSIRIEAMGDGADDHDYLSLIAAKVGDASAEGIAWTDSTDSRGLTGGVLKADDYMIMRDYMIERILRDHAGVTVFKDIHNVADSSGIRFIPYGHGFITLAPTRTVQLKNFESGTGLSTLGPARYEIITADKTEGRSAVEITFNRKKMFYADRNDLFLSQDQRTPVDSKNGFALKIAELPVTDWSAFRYLEFDARCVTDNFGLYDVIISFNDEYSTRYWIGSETDWNAGEQGHQIGYYSLDGTFPGKWRHVRMDINAISGIGEVGQKGFNLPENRRAITQVLLRMGIGSGINEPLPDTDYILLVDNMRLINDDYVTEGWITGKPARVDTAAAYDLYWVADFHLPTGTSLRFETRSGPSPDRMGKWTPTIPAGKFMASILSPNNAYLQWRVTLTSSGDHSPTLREVGFLKKQ